MKLFVVFFFVRSSVILYSGQNDQPVISFSGQLFKCVLTDDNQQILVDLLILLFEFQTSLKL